jgi:hypothetical protein
MTVARFAISFDRALAREVRKAAGSQPTSAWLADAARKKLRAAGLARAVEQWEAVHGVLDEADLRAAARRRRRRAR